MRRLEICARESAPWFRSTRFANSCLHGRTVTRTGRSRVGGRGLQAVEVVVVVVVVVVVAVAVAVADVGVVAVAVVVAVAAVHHQTDV